MENIEKRYIEQIYPRLVKIREDLHQCPEKAFQEYQTSEYLRKVLEEEKISYETVGATGIVATIRGEKKGTRAGKEEKILAFRTDMDGLPMEEETDLEWKSRNGWMHSCGHDMHMTMVLGAGIILNREKRDWSGTVKLIFQPAEEIGEGAEQMIASGKLNGTDTIVALHMNPQEEKGKFLTGYGARTTQGICLDLTIEKNAGTVENAAIEAATKIVELVDKKTASEKNFKNHISLSPTIINTEENGNVKLFYDGRTFCDDDSDRLEELIDHITDIIEPFYSVTVRKEVDRIGGSVQNDTGEVKRTEKVLTELYGRDSWVDSPPAMFGEDFRCYAKIIPHLVFSMLGGSAGETRYGLHNCHVTFDNSALKAGAGYYVGYARDYFKEHAFERNFSVSER